VGYEVVRLLDSAHLNYMCTLSFVAILCLITFSLFFAAYRQTMLQNIEKLSEKRLDGGNMKN
jgi:hypothetical protein